MSPHSNVYKTSLSPVLCLPLLISSFSNLVLGRNAASEDHPSDAVSLLVENYPTKTKTLACVPSLTCWDRQGIFVVISTIALFNVLVALGGGMWMGVRACMDVNVNDEARSTHIRVFLGVFHSCSEVIRDLCNTGYIPNVQIYNPLLEQVCMDNFHDLLSNCIGILRQSQVSVI